MNYMNYKGPESLLLNFFTTMLFSALYQLQLPEEQCGGVRSELSASWHKEPFLYVE